MLKRQRSPISLKSLKVIQEKVPVDGDIFKNWLNFMF